MKMYGWLALVIVMGVGCDVVLGLEEGRPIPDTECRRWACTGATCGYENVAARTPCGDNGECDGYGACRLRIGNTCSAAEQCASGYCVDGNCCAEFCAPNTGINTCTTGQCVHWSWADWPMPNPADSPTELPNHVHYTPDAAKGIVVDDVTHLMWQRVVPPDTFTWENAKTYCANLEFGGFADWRLPTRIELVSLLDFTKQNPAIDAVAFPDTPSSRFWTSSPSAGSSSSAWIVNFFNGHTYNDGVTGAYRVRCVR
ncbi:MAG TPA: DUF1566 domain-containing protein [Polyangium sp.]|nr:DUF1566 domain-containing protein [Polyangium sp.]